MDPEKRYKKEIEAFGQRLREIREQKSLSQLELENLSGLARTEISRIENGQKNIEFRTVVKLAEALEMEVWELFK